MSRVAVFCLVLLLIASVRADDPPAKTWWSFRPLAKPAVPDGRHPGFAVRNPIDAFVLARLKEKGLTPSPEADRRTLIRRLTFDLTGLPPTPSEVESFLKDGSPDAYEKLVDRLLASPHYGERWARHWMDAVHFAETHGHDQDRVREHAWRYRDYLIEAFNTDRRYDRFVKEQLAADVLYPDQPRLTPALGFLAAGPWDESSLRDIREDSIDREAGRYLDRDDMLTTAMATFQSLTVNCSRCHDHKFDPIPQEDYYALQAVFAGVGRGDVNYDPDPRTTAARARWQAAAAVAGPAAGAGSRPPDPLIVYAASGRFTPDGSHRPLPAPRPVHMLKRGDIRRPGPAATPGTVSCLPGLADRFELPANHPEGERRAALARWLTDPANPLTWRSIVNRMWHYHFGRGIVDTPNDLGKMGGTPTHPELLDWLAVTFRDGGQSFKALHRLIVTSSTYRQVSAHRPEPAKADGDNHYLWRMPRGRLDAEQVRDAILQVSGRLDRTRGGPSDRQFALRPGVHVTPVVEYRKFDWDRPQGHRRSVYRFVFRTLPDPLVACLDGADASQLTPVRTQSVTAPQALALFNDDFVLAHAKAMAADLAKSAPDRQKQVAEACRRLWGRAPTTAESAELTAYAEKHGLANLCRVLFNSNEFLFVD